MQASMQQMYELKGNWNHFSIPIPTIYIHLKMSSFSKICSICMKITEQKKSHIRDALVNISKAAGKSANRLWELLRGNFVQPH